MLRGQLLKWLQDFRKEDFNAQAIQTLISLPWTPEFAPEAIRLVGIAEAATAIPRLKAEIREAPTGTDWPTGYYASNAWAALLALARLGDSSSLERIIRQVQNESDIVIRATILFGDLGYTRRSAAFTVLKTYMNSDQRLPAVKETVPGRIEACYAAAVFSKSTGISLASMFASRTSETINSVITSSLSS
jgi:hypothetical protein